MKELLRLLMKVIKLLVPKSRWANVVYLILGYAAANWDGILKLVDSIVK